MDKGPLNVCVCVWTVTGSRQRTDWYLATELVAREREDAKTLAVCELVVQSLQLLVVLVGGASFTRHVHDQTHVAADTTQRDCMTIHLHNPTCQYFLLKKNKWKFKKNGKTSTDSIQFEVTRISCQTYALDVAFCLATILSKLLTAETVPLKLLL